MKIVLLVLCLAVTVRAIPVFAADDNPKIVADAPPASNAAPIAGLTERERWLLGRVEQLEERVAELESKVQKPLATGLGTPPPAPASPTSATTASVTPGLAISSHAHTPAPATTVAAANPAVP